MERHKVSESIFSGRQHTIPMADVQYAEKRFHTHDLVNGTKRGEYMGTVIITKHTKWSADLDDWENPIYLSKEEAVKFMAAWCFYRHELEGGGDAFKGPQE